MSRMGMEGWEIDAFVADQAIAAHIDLRFLISHLACADEPDHVANVQQAARFKLSQKSSQSAPRSGQ
jgi:alanine racemase